MRGARQGEGEPPRDSQTEHAGPGGRGAEPVPGSLPLHHSRHGAGVVAVHHDSFAEANTPDFSATACGWGFRIICGASESPASPRWLLAG